MITFLNLDGLRAARAEPRETRWPDRPVVTLGFFDGLHLGHQRILSDLADWSVDVEGAPVVVTFDRQPREVLVPRPPVTVSTLEHRLFLLARIGVEAALVLHFDRELASWTPEVFVERVLREALGARRFLLGFDSTIGRDRLGTFEYLKAREAKLGIEVRRSEPYFLEGARVSSTLVRESISQGDLQGLKRLLGRSFSVLGQVLKGDGRGRQLGFPTANLNLPARGLPPRGVYFGRAAVVPSPVRKDSFLEIQGEQGSFHSAVANIGIRPTFTPGRQTLLLEIHLLDFEGDLYGKILEVELLKWHREEKRFSNSRKLIDQIERDIESRRSFDAP